MQLMLLIIFLVAATPVCWGQGTSQDWTQQKRQYDNKLPVALLDQRTHKRRWIPDDDAVIFAPGASTTATHENKTESQIPVSIFMEMSKITTTEEFVQKFVKKGNLMMFRERTASDPFATQAVCSPQPTTIPIDLKKDAFVVYFPACTRLERCGGCCLHDLLECSPTRNETVPLQVVKSRYLGPEGGFDVAEPETIFLDRHLECKCQCRVKASDCTSFQIYRPNECRCACLNQDKAAACAEHKFWDTDKCACLCKEAMECTTGFIFNNDTCSCEAPRSSRLRLHPAFKGLLSAFSKSDKIPSVNSFDTNFLLA